MQLSSWRDRRSGVGHLMGRDGSPQYQPTPGGTAMQLRDRRAGVGHLMGRDISPQYQHRPNSRRDSNAAEFLEGQEVRGRPPHGEGWFPPISASTQLQEGGWWIN